MLDELTPSLSRHCHADRVGLAHRPARRLRRQEKAPVHPINLNTATSGELQRVPGIGVSTADKILKMRKSYGPFKSVDDLRAIKGIGPKRLEKMRKYLTVDKSTVATKPRAAPTAAAQTPLAPGTRPGGPLPQTLECSVQSTAFGE